MTVRVGLSGNAFSVKRIFKQGGRSEFFYLIFSYLSWSLN